ncbi:MAG: eukaryotic-like serine/threonine-protein kinase [Thermoanaerobaculia bacterium]|jgi:serine/threonine-protein kinase|nr:eukaryotic-like serine/threonine-protein kinase [Thermoanaerobaculia bacterium]
MSSCPSCSAEIPAGARFCSSCGAGIDISSAGTVHRNEARPPSSSSEIDHGRFVPGAMFGNRYRMVALLGKGGMGEVYRADDLKLNQAVALKLLPKQLGGDEKRRERLLGEVRVARQVAHPNVCRVYDVGEIEGEYFITMEYVLGEDLASLIHRIGRFQKEKGIEIARQICAGLAAAHERGILHRDLKPANIMLDERGRVRVTDFGLAAAVDDAGTNAGEGTPAYMAPEQLAGREISARSDIYALGLVLYELFTGKRAFNATSVVELREQREQRSITEPSQIVDDLDPAVERVILRCLEPEPRDRPQSVLAVMAALPGGDPLAAALAAGETPSPELLAAAGDSVGLKASMAILLLLFVIVGSLVVLLLKLHNDLPSYTDLDLPPEALTLKARELIRQFGYSGKGADFARGFRVDDDLTRYISEHDKSPQRWEQLRSLPVVRFWYRDAPASLEWNNFFVSRVTQRDPPLEYSGMKLITLDASGKLIGFDAVPEQIESAQPATTAIDANALFAAAGLDPLRFKAAAPRWIPQTWDDWRGAWEGAWPDGTPLRVEAAAYHGRLVYFKEVSPWTRPSRMEASPKTARQKFLTWTLSFFFSAIVLSAAFFARRNQSLGRGDRRGATRLSFAVFLIVLVSRLFGTTHLSTASEIGVIIQAVGMALFIAAMLWLLYLACEPYVRRRWPHALIALGKILSGRLRDPLVGRDVLIGTAAGVALSIVWGLSPIITRLVGGTTAAPYMNALALFGFRYSCSLFLFHLFRGVWIAFAHTMLFLLFRIVLRREALAFAALLVIAALIGALRSDDNAVTGLVSAFIAGGLLLVVLTRLGLVAALFVVTVSSWLPETVVVGFSGWAAYTVWLPLVATAVVATSAFYISLAGRPLFRDALLET